MKGLVLGCLVAVVMLAGHVSGQLFSVSKEQGNWTLTADVAMAQVETNPNATGWATIDVVTNAAHNDMDQAYAAGYIEGALHWELIYNSWISQLQYFYNGEFNADAAAWIAKNDAWVRSKVEVCHRLSMEDSVYEKQDCAYWYQIGLVLTQLDGMVQGYNDHCDSDRHVSYDIILYVNIASDIGDIMTAIDILYHCLTNVFIDFVVNPSTAPKTPQEVMEKDHCSVLVKYSAELQKLYHSHTTWGHYVNMLRCFKHYTLQYSSAVSKSVSFSSFPGFISSGDDFFITDRGLIVTETTNNVFNMSLYKNVTPQTVLYWLRVVVANRMANNGSEWVSIFAKYNSGTYNNQWQVTDTKLFTPGQPIQPETLYILEQIPGYIVSADATSFLINDGYFPSYNIPYFPFIYNISGYPEQYEQYGDGYSYSACPRANIFRRDQSKVVTLQDMQDIMRYNEYQTDPFSLGDPCNAISARCDLNTTTVQPFGGYDCKVSDTDMIVDMITQALSGPTTLTQPAFSWTGPFADIPHWGQPTVFNFTFEQMQPIQLV